MEKPYSYLRFLPIFKRYAIMLLDHEHGNDKGTCNLSCHDSNESLAQLSRTLPDYAPIII